MWFWVALVLASWAKPIWQRIQRSRAATWPLADGHIESVNVYRPSKWFRTSSHATPDVAEMGYSYSVEGSIHGGVSKREFPSADAAWEFVRDLRGKAVAVHYNPARHSVSAISEPSIDTLIQARSPLPDSLSQHRKANPVPFWVRPFLWIGVVYSAIGLSLSLWVHIAALRGERVVPEAFFFGLHLGIFVVWFPTFFVARELTRDLQRKQDYWKVALKDAPDWMRYMVYGFLGYAVLNFVLFIMSSPPSHTAGGPTASEWRGFSGHWMAFYAAALAILYSAANYGSSSRSDSTNFGG